MSKSICQFCNREFASDVAVRNHQNKAEACKAARAALEHGAAADARPTKKTARAVELELPDADAKLGVAYERAVYEYRVEFGDQVFQLNKEYVQNRGNVYTILLKLGEDGSTRYVPVGSFQAKDGKPTHMRAVNPDHQAFVERFAVKFGHTKALRFTTKGERVARAMASAES